MEQASFDQQCEDNSTSMAGNHRTPDGPACLNGLPADSGSNPGPMTDGPNPTHPQTEQLNKIKQVPKEVGVMLITAGIVGFILPGTGNPGHHCRRIGTLAGGLRQAGIMARLAEAPDCTAGASNRSIVFSKTWKSAIPTPRSSEVIAD